MERIILHVDINACYASIEQLHHPELRGKPVVVGGDVEARHGIVLTKSQEAKPYGIQVGMALWQARKRCPNVIIVPPNYKLYLRYSREIRRLFSNYTNQVEPFGLDEAWLDISGSTHLFGSGEKVAEEIRQRVKDELGVTVSIGVSWNKIFAKLGSDYKKPDAITVISKENYKDIVWPLRVTDLSSIHENVQLSMYGDEMLREKQMHIEQAVDDLRRRFGHYVIGRAIYSLDPKLRQFNAKGDHTIHPIGYFSNVK